MDEVRFHVEFRVRPCSDTRSFHSANIFVWSIALLSQAACKNFGGLFACRAFLGICEGAITPGFMIVTSMFYTRKEQSQRVGYWCKLIPQRSSAFSRSSDCSQSS